MSQEKIRGGKSITEPTGGGKMNMICKHCGKNIAIRNPSGFCDHLYYPDNCEICKREGKNAKKIKI